MNPHLKEKFFNDNVVAILILQGCNSTAQLVLLETKNSVVHELSVIGIIPITKNKKAKKILWDRYQTESR